MDRKLIFLSHIHEEKDMALVLKDAIEAEFSGFIDVFVSSDGVTIPAGANFLKRIEDGLITCCAAVYLISPKSVKRSWINFELGAVWVRNVAQLRVGGPEIPTVPVCHSGMTPATLPPPLNNLNAILASDAAQMESAFLSLQTALGGRGKLKTRFPTLVGKLIELEKRYTVGTKVRQLLHMAVGDGNLQQLKPLVEQCEANKQIDAIEIKKPDMTNDALVLARQLESNDLRDLIKAEVRGVSNLYGDFGTKTVADVSLFIKTWLLVEHKDEILS